MFGGLVVDDSDKDVKASTTNDTYLVNVNEKDIVFTKVDCRGDVPLKRACHTACALNAERMFMFGGYYDNKIRLNDVCFLHVTPSEYVWKRPPNHPAVTDPPKNEPSTIGAPEPRADASCCLLGSKVYIFGGYGGIHYQRKNFNDLYSYDLEKFEWTKIEYENVAPEPRSGHVIFPHEANSLYLFGGWSNENYSGVLVNAIPNKKYFVFGGMTGDFDEGKERQVGVYTNRIFYVDLDSVAGFTWHNVELDESSGVKPDLPTERSRTSMFYDERFNRTVIFGGWSNKWLGDAYALNVGKIVGPDYAIKSMDPDKGQLSGGTKVTIKGIGFAETGSMIVRFQSGKQFAEAPATYVSPDELVCTTPSFDQFGPKEVEVKLQRLNEDLSITSCRFSFFKNTRAVKSLAYGPGISEKCLAGSDAEFLIQARNEDGENRTSGRDTFEAKGFLVETKQVKVDVMGEEFPRIDTVEEVLEEIPCEVVDKGDGSYFIKYNCKKPGKVKVEVKFKNEKGIMEIVRGFPYYTTLVPDGLTPAHNKLDGPMIIDNVHKTLDELESYMKDTLVGASSKDKDIKNNVKTLLKVKEHVRVIESRKDEIALKLDVIDEALKLFHKQGRHKDPDTKKLRDLTKTWNDVQNLAKVTKKEIKSVVEQEQDKTQQKVKSFEEQMKVYASDIKKKEFYFYSSGVETALKKLESAMEDYKGFQAIYQDKEEDAAMFGVPTMMDASKKQLKDLKAEIESMTLLWNHIKKCLSEFERFSASSLLKGEIADMIEDVKKLKSGLDVIKVDRKGNDAHGGISKLIYKWTKFLGLADLLKDPSMKERHWQKLSKEVGKEIKGDDKLTLRDIFVLDLDNPKMSDKVDDITLEAKQQLMIERKLADIRTRWESVSFIITPYKGGVNEINIKEEEIDKVDEDQTTVQSMVSNKYVSNFEKEVEYWRSSLFNLSENFMGLRDVWKSWMFLEKLFIGSEELKKELPQKAEEFVAYDAEVKALFKNAEETKIVHKFCNQDGLAKKLDKIIKNLQDSERALTLFMEQKRRAFPRFYFVARDDLLTILARGDNPTRVMEFFPKIFRGIKDIKMQDNPGDRPMAMEMNSNEDGVLESVKFIDQKKLTGKVERYLADIITMMRTTLRQIARDSVARHDGKKRKDWLKEDPAQITHLVNLSVWVRHVEAAIKTIEQGDKDGMQKCFEFQVTVLNELISYVKEQLPKDLRQKVKIMIIMDTHSRDIIEKLQNAGVNKVDDFQWQCQLKAYWANDDFRLNIGDAEFWYWYEYIGNGNRLVVTPLTDRIYVTATQALHLMMGCSPSGPAGTGKTETTKDLACAMGKPCYVFNCSDAMSNVVMGVCFKGIASSGAWGCFDEFNRLIPETLSVCSMQFGSIIEAMKKNQKRFLFAEEDEIDLDDTCGVFITMNPGYLGRSELPEGLKTLFRPITVVVPDFELIAEILLMAEGFIKAKILARKFIILYSLCQDLLSKQAHYDWSLRSIKSVLAVAGGFKREEPDLDELALLKRALRDFNLSKILVNDIPVIMGLLEDLFPGIQVERKRDARFEEVISDVVRKAKLHPEPRFIEKVIQLKELMVIRHCIFVMGPAGAGKSAAWKMLIAAFNADGKPSLYQDLNPKTVSTLDLYGYNTPAGEWRMGLLSYWMKYFSEELKDDRTKWIVLDGDLDTKWIESMNSVMDDTKMLTLASSDRIVLKLYMRMIFEIRDLRFASPATVSRAGILYISDTDGYQADSYFESWLIRQEYPVEKQKDVEKLYAFYVHKILLELKKSYKFMVPVVDISMVMSLCKLLEAMVPDKEKEAKALEYVFAYCCVWAFGGGLLDEDQRVIFSNYFKGFGKIRYPAGHIYEYYPNQESVKWEKWADAVTEIGTYAPGTPISEITVPTQETVRAITLMKAFVGVGSYPMLIGYSGCGKTQTCKGMLRDINLDKYTSMTINFNYFTDAKNLQDMMEKPLKRQGKVFAPPANKRLIYYLDDVNMPCSDEYDTQTAIELLRQNADYSHWFDRIKLKPKNIENTQYLASMNPTAGSFSISARLQRHFWLLAVPTPEQDSLNKIYTTFLTTHFRKFKQAINEQVQPILKAALAVHSAVCSRYKKTAINFHYEFSVRHISKVFQGILQAQPVQFSDPEKLIKLWIHESERIYCDRLVSEEDIKDYKKMMSEKVKNHFTKFTNLYKCTLPENAEFLVFSTFATGLHEKVYDQIPTLSALGDLLNEALREYNDVNAKMNLVLFEDAMRHVCKISRVIADPGGHVLNVGVGGSGKLSLSKLSMFICGYTPKELLISGSYDMVDLKNDIQMAYQRAGVKEEGTLFFFTEGVLRKDDFLRYINDILSSGEIADLYTSDEKDQLLSSMRTAAKAAGIPENQPDLVYNYFITRVKLNLHLALCFSPGNKLRQRASKFPAIVNCTVIDWFQPWPKEALRKVTAENLSAIEMPSEEVRQAVVDYMPESFEKVNQASAEVLFTDRRYIYTTPKSFLELIKLFKNMLERKKCELESAKKNYEEGVERLKQTEELAVKLAEELKVTSVVVEEKRKTAEENAVQVEAAKKIVEENSTKANEEAKKCAEKKLIVEEKQTKVQKDLDAAQPLVEKAKANVADLNAKLFQTIKGWRTAPPKKALNIGFCIIHLLYDPNSDFIETEKGGPKLTWPTFLSLMEIPSRLKEILLGMIEKINEGKVAAKNFKECNNIIISEKLDADGIKSTSAVLVPLFDWINNMLVYYDTIAGIEPKRLALREANEQLKEATTKKETIDAQVAELQGKLNVLQAEFKKVIDAKQEAEATAGACARRLDIANRLMKALGSESERWASSIDVCASKIGVILGDVLLASSFVSYLGPFNKKYREKIMNDNFVTFVQEHGIPMSEEFKHIDILTDDATKALWINQGLPDDPFSKENGAILENSERWALMIDPQIQGNKWIRKKEESHNLQVIRLTGMADAKESKKIMQKFEVAIESGTSIMIENMEEEVNAVVMPVIAKNYIVKGKNKILPLGDKQLNYNDGFRLFLQTKLSNPHFPPEIQAETTMINFAVTEEGLEDQLLAHVVRRERPDLASKREELVQQQNEYTIKLKELEKLLLYKLTNTTGDIFENIELVESLEKSKALAEDISKKSIAAKETSAQIEQTSELYRPVAARGALIFFVMTELSRVHSFYMFSLASFINVVNRALAKAQADWRAAQGLPPKEGEGKAEGKEDKKEEKKDEKKEEKTEGKEEVKEEDKPLEMASEEVIKHVTSITEELTYQSFIYIRRGLFEKDRLLVAVRLCFRIKEKMNEIDPAKLSHLVIGRLSTETPQQPESLKQFMTETMFRACKALEDFPVFQALLSQMEAEAVHWKKWYMEEKAEVNDLPKQFKNIDLFDRMLLLRALRPDRVTNALEMYIQQHMGTRYQDVPPFQMIDTFPETSAKIPVFFVLFPGQDPTKDVRVIAKREGMKDEDLVNIPMGQGQEDNAIRKLHAAADNGGWIMLQNIHLMQMWLKTLETHLEEITGNPKTHVRFRCFLSSEPPGIPELKTIPETILQSCIKVANEAPQDLKNNMRRAFSMFRQDRFDKCTKQHEFKALLFALTMYHSLLLGRRKYGPLGWCKRYNFNEGDLMICADVLSNYLNKYEKVPYDDLRYMFGEIMYGGHITDEWDRRTNAAYLRELIRPELLQGANLIQGYKSPDPSKTDRESYVKYIEKLPPESPELFKMDSNADIGLLTMKTDSLFKDVITIQGGAGIAGASKRREDLVREKIALVKAGVPKQPYVMLELFAKVKERTPYIIVCLQECERMNCLLDTIKTTIEELDLGYKGQLNINESMEHLADFILLERVPTVWKEVIRSSSKKPLSSWLANINERYKQLTKWSENFTLDKECLSISLLFNPMAFITAVKQVTARQEKLPLDYMALSTKVKNFLTPEEIPGPPESGAYIYGMYLQGACWKTASDRKSEGYLAQMKARELTPALPVVNVVAIPLDKRQTAGYYECPVYSTTDRGFTYVFTAGLRMESMEFNVNNWILAGVALVMENE